MKRAILISATLAVAGCTLVVGSLHECTSNSDCAAKGTGLVCQQNLCVTPAYVDAGIRIVDAGPPDAGFNDPLCQTLLGAVDAGPFGYPDAGKTLFFGAILPKTVGTTGVPDARGIPRQDAIQLVVDTFNMAGGIGGRYLVVRVCDDQGTASVAETEATELAQEGAPAIITPGSGETEAAAASANPLGAVIMSESGSAAALGSTGLVPDGGPKMVWSTAASDNLQAEVLAQLINTTAAGGGGYKNPAVLWRNDNSYGNGLSAALVADVQSLDAGLTFPAQRSVYFDDNDDNVGAQAQAVAQLSPAPDVLVIIGTPYEADLAITSYPPPYPAWMFSDNAESVDLLTGLDGGYAPYGLIGSYGTGPATAGSGTPVYLAFSQAFQQEFKFDPATQGYLPNTYDATMLVALGLWYGNSQGAVSGVNIATLFTKVSNSSATQTPLEPSVFSELTAPLTLNEPLNVQGASGDLNFDNSTGVAPGPIQKWQVDADGGIGLLLPLVNPLP